MNGMRGLMLYHLCDEQNTSLEPHRRAETRKTGCLSALKISKTTKSVIKNYQQVGITSTLRQNLNKQAKKLTYIHTLAEVSYVGLFSLN